jgi:hypothetical protein
MNDFIEGIYNYCDRWCERCTLSLRCSSYAVEKKLEEIKKSGGTINRSTFWEIFDSLFEGAFKNLSDFQSNDHLEPDTFEEMDQSLTDFEPFEDEVWRKVEENELVEHARFYATEVVKWMQTYESDIVSCISQPDIDAKHNKDLVLNSIEVVMWYTFFIAAKLHRALRRDKEEFLELPVDSDENGSAKIALIAINRSISAWSIIRSAYKTDQNTTGSFMGRLIAIRRVVEQAFPRAHEFVRPGFDTE